MNMSRCKFFLLQLFLILSVFASAEERTLEQARDLAYDFMQSRIRVRSAVLDLRMVYDGEIIGARSVSSPAYYVFNNEAGPGFVIVSAEDSSIPVLGYSDSFNFSETGMPSNLRWWLKTMRSQINDLRSAGAPSVAASYDVGTDVISYETALWNQGAPYYNACPMYYGSRSVTGCGPTAIAIAMRAREWPDAGVGTIPSYVTESYGITVPSRTLGTAYDWDNMPLTDGEVEYWTSAQKSQVSRLIADIGAATEADYHPDGTGIYDDIVPLALGEYMKYDKGIYTAWREAYSSTEWYPLIKEEMKNGPVIYSGSDDVAGHMFVLDGYTTKDYFRVNWGWGGMANGYYLLTALNPEDQGIGSNELGTYNQYQAAVIGMKPDEGGQAIDMIRFYAEDGYNGLVKEVEEFRAGVQYTVDSGYYVNYGNNTYNGSIRIVVIDEADAVRQVLYEESLSLDPFYMAWFSDVTFTLDSIEPGYRLVAQFYDNVAGEWQMVRGNTDEGVIESVLLAEAAEEPVNPEDTIEKTTTLTYTHATRTVTLTTKDGVDVKCTLANGDGVWVTKNPDGSYKIVLDHSSVSVYYIDLSKGSEFKRIEIAL